jgi:N-acetylgalactosamine kinase
MTRPELTTTQSLRAMLRDPASEAWKALSRIYPAGVDIACKAALCLEAVAAFEERFGVDRRVFVVRSAGRVNLIGMHVEHRGGYINPVAARDIFLVVEPRSDDEVHMCNADPQFRACRFRISEELPQDRGLDWDSWISEVFDARKKAGHGGDWANYFKAAALYFQHIHRAGDGSFAPALRGMNVAVRGDVPIAAGLSSSSSVVVGAADAILHLNGLSLALGDFVEACGRAEWYIGTRGGAGDHAAIKLGRKDEILRARFFPFECSHAPLPRGYCIVLANSLVQAKKQDGARDTFNERVASYIFGQLFLEKRFPALAGKMAHLRDVNPRTLGVTEAQVYRMIGALPECTTRAALLVALPEQSDQLARTFRTHAEPAKGYRIRQVCMYGIAECIRSELAGDLLARGDVSSVGELINLQHDGDRVSRSTNGDRVPTDNSLTDAAIASLIADAESAESCRIERSRLWRQPGGYDCSCRELDILVDIARSVPGVAGAGLVGAGLGGSIAALAEEGCANRLLGALDEGYYRPRGLALAAEIIRPVGGAGVLDMTAGK